jgi:two-component system, NarL family, nitrate/nitrite response regulator NarL
MVRHSQTIGTVIIGQRELFREGVAALLRNTSYKTIASAKRCSELKDLRSSVESRILTILGASSNDEISECRESVKRLRSLFPGAAIVVIAEAREPTNLHEMLMAAADGYVTNLTSRDVLLRALELALLDQRVIVLPQLKSPPALASHQRDLANRTTFADADAAVGIKDPLLSRREREILTRLAEGDSNKQIARVCNITESTVKVHLKAILRKITVHNRTQAAIWAIGKGYHVVVDQTLSPRYGLGGRANGGGEAAAMNISRK